MFETLEKTEITVEPFARDIGHRYWPYILSSFNSYWFFVVYSTKSLDIGSLNNFLFVRKIDELLSLINSGQINATEIYLIFPDQLNSKKTWEMELIKEIFCAQEPGLEFEQDAYIFVLENDDRYIDSAISTVEEKLINKKSIYSYKV